MKIRYSETQRAAEQEDQYDQHGHGHVDADPEGIALVDGIQVADAGGDADEVELHVVPCGIRLALLLLQPVVDGPQQTHALLREGIVIADQIETRDLARELAAGEKVLAALFQDRPRARRTPRRLSRSFCQRSSFFLLNGSPRGLVRLLTSRMGVTFLPLAIDVNEPGQFDGQVADLRPLLRRCRSCRRRAWRGS